MAAKKNCWEYKNCGRQPGGEKVHLLGECPAAIDSAHDGLNCGDKGGRICWAITGTFCGGTVQGTFAKKQASCMACDFFGAVRSEEGPGLVMMKP